MRGEVYIDSHAIISTGKRIKKRILKKKRLMFLRKKKKDAAALRRRSHMDQSEQETWKYVQAPIIQVDPSTIDTDALALSIAQAQAHRPIHSYPPFSFLFPLLSQRNYAHFRNYRHTEPLR